jgi:hypothetical protein
MTSDGGRQEVTTEPVIELSPDTDYPSSGTSNRNGGSYRRSGSFSSSTAAYNDINATLGSFYETPKEDPEKEALKAEVEQLKQAAAIQQPAHKPRSFPSAKSRIFTKIFFIHSEF